MSGTNGGETMYGCSELYGASLKGRDLSGIDLRLARFEYAETLTLLMRH
jgi:hypothetical protein